MQRRRYCAGDCDYKFHYSDQAGAGISNFYRGVPFQRGYGFWGDMFTRYGVPVMKYLGKQVLSTGANLAHDIAEQGIAPRRAFQQRLKQAARDTGIAALNRATPILVKEAVDRLQQTGTGRKRKRRKTAKAVPKKKSRAGSRKKPKKKNVSRKKTKRRGKRNKDVFS